LLLIGFHPRSKLRGIQPLIIENSFDISYISCYILYMSNKTINVNELQSNISSIIRRAEEGEIFEVMRYSKPVAVVLSYEQFLSLRGECRKCIGDLRKIAGKINSKDDPSTTLSSSLSDLGVEDRAGE